MSKRYRSLELQQRGAQIANTYSGRPVRGLLMLISLRALKYVRPKYHASCYAQDIVQQRKPTVRPTDRPTDRPRSFSVFMVDSMRKQTMFPSRNVSLSLDRTSRHRPTSVSLSLPNRRADGNLQIGGWRCLRLIVSARILRLRSSFEITLRSFVVVSEIGRILFFPPSVPPTPQGVASIVGRSVGLHMG